MEKNQEVRFFFIVGRTGSIISPNGFADPDRDQNETDP